MPRRSYHFIPADRPKLFERVAGLGADAYVFDLEDAVAADRKLEAVELLSKWFSTLEPQINFFVRVNHLGGLVPDEEIELLDRFPWLGVIYPKVETSEEVALLESSWSTHRQREQIALIESAGALASIDEILGSQRFSGVGLGLEDFLSDSIFSARQLPYLVRQIRSTFTLAAMRFGLSAIDTISTDLSGGTQLEEDCLEARKAGMHAKFSIHPSQIEHINRVFAPAPEAVEEALQLNCLIKDVNPDQGYFTAEGVVLSPPKIRKLQKILQDYQNL